MKRFLAVFCLAAGVQAAMVTSSVDCTLYKTIDSPSTPDQVLLSFQHPFSCSTNQYSSVVESDAWFSSTSTDTSVSASVATRVVAAAHWGDFNNDGINEPSPLARSIADIEMALVLVTQGVQRDGIMRYNVSAFGGHSQGGASVSFVSPYLQYQCNTDGENCLLPVSTGIDGDIPVLLGTQFALSIRAHSAAAGGSGMPGGAFSEVQFFIQFFEADGITPVLLTPEPSTWMAGIGLVGLLSLRRLRQLP